MTKHILTADNGDKFEVDISGLRPLAGKVELTFAGVTLCLQPYHGGQTYSNVPFPICVEVTSDCTHDFITVAQLRKVRDQIDTVLANF